MKALVAMSDTFYKKYFYKKYYRISPFLFLSPNFPICHSPLPFKIMAFSPLIIIVCIYLQLQIYTPKYNLLSPDNVSYMCVFRDDCLSVDKQLVCSSLGKITSSALSPSCLSIVLLVGLKPHGLSPCSLWHVHCYSPCSAPIWMVIEARLHWCSF